jgi:hypothetical protein
MQAFGPNRDIDYDRFGEEGLARLAVSMTPARPVRSQNSIIGAAAMPSLDLDLDGCLSAASLDRPQRVVEPYAWIEHIPFAFWLIDALRPKTFVELGTHTGNSFFAFCQAAAAYQPTMQLTAIDTWQGDEHAGRYDNSVYEDVRRYCDATYPTTAKLLRDTFANARAEFEAGSIDVLHIDGLHTYEAVKDDFMTWQDTVSACGVVLFHDTAIRDHGFGVWRLWAELAKRYPAFEFAHGNGLGVLAVGAAVPQPIRALCGLSASKAEMVRTIYHRLGGSVVDLQSKFHALQHEMHGIQTSRSWKIATKIANAAALVRRRR